MRLKKKGTVHDMIYLSLNTERLSGINMLCGSMCM